MASSELALKPVESKLAEFAAFVQGIEVKDGNAYKYACERIVAARAEVKKIGFVLDPGIASAREHLQTLQNQKAAFVNRWTEQIAIAEKRAEDFKKAEREATERERQRQQKILDDAAAVKAADERREADRIAEENRKARQKEIDAQVKAGEVKKREAERLKKQAEEDEAKSKQLNAQQAEVAAKAAPQVKVEANIPKVAGIKARVNWKFKIVDPTKVKRAYCKPDTVTIGDKVRELKNKAAAELEIGGIEVDTEDSV